VVFVPVWFGRIGLAFKRKPHPEARGREEKKSRNHKSLNKKYRL